MENGTVVYWKDIRFLPRFVGFDGAIRNNEQVIRDFFPPIFWNSIGNELIYNILFALLFYSCHFVAIIYYSRHIVIDFFKKTLRGCQPAVRMLLVFIESKSIAEPIWRYRAENRKWR